MELLTRQHFDAVLTDKNLPGLSGVDFAIKARAHSARTAIFLITAYASRESATTLMRADIDDYFSKPFELDFLARRIETAIAKRRAMAEPASVPVETKPIQARIVLTMDNAAVRARLARLLQRMTHTAILEDSPLPLIAARPPPDGLIVDAARLDLPLRDAIWTLQEQQPRVRIIVLADPNSLADAIASISVGAFESLPPTVPDEEAERVFLRAWSRGS